MDSDASTLKAAIPAADIAFPGSLSITVHTAAIAGGGTSPSATLSVSPPTPALASSNAISPATIVAGSADFTLSVTGSGFQPSSVVRWNGTEKATTHVSPTELRATIPSTDVATAGTCQVSVFTPSPGGGASGAATFTIENPVPTLATSSTFTPASVSAGDAAFNLTVRVRGTNFVATSVVRWNGAARTTTFVSATELTAAITAADVAAAGIAQITVFTPAPGGGETGAQPLQVRERPGAFALASLANDGGLGNDISLLSVPSSGAAGNLPSASERPEIDGPIAAVSPSRLGTRRSSGASVVISRAAIAPQITGASSEMSSLKHASCWLTCARDVIAPAKSTPAAPAFAPSARDRRTALPFERERPLPRMATSSTG